MEAIDPGVVEMVQAWLEEAGDLREREKQALFVFAHRINPEVEDKGWASLDYMAEVSGINRKTLSRGLVDLVNRGILVNLGNHQGKSRGSMERRITDLAWADIERVWEARSENAGTTDSLASRLGSRTNGRAGRNTFLSERHRDTLLIRKDTFGGQTGGDTVGTSENLALENGVEGSDVVHRDTRCPLNQSIANPITSKTTRDISLVTGTPQDRDNLDQPDVPAVPRSRFDEIREEMAAKRSLQS